MSKHDELGRGAAKSILGYKGVRMFIWTVILYMCGVFWMSYQMPNKVLLFEAMGLAIVSFLSCYGTMSLVIDIFDNKVRARIKRFFKVIKNEAGSNKIQQDVDSH